MFVDKAYRGHDKKIAQSLLNTLINWSKGQKWMQSIWGTTAKSLAAHRFYEKISSLKLRRLLYQRNFQ